MNIMMFNIILIGFGNMARNHLLSIGGLNSENQIYIVENDYQLFSKSIEEFKSRDIKFLSDFSQIDRDFDLAIITTKASERLEAVSSLLKWATPQNIILEKNLTSNVEDLYQMKEIVDTNPKINFFVNLWVREFRILTKKIKELKVTKPSAIFIKFSDKSLLTNLIHFVDYFYFIFGIEIKQILETGDHKWICGKRKETVEYIGELKLLNSGNITYELISTTNFDNSKGGVRILIISAQGELLLVFLDNKCQIFLNNIFIDEFQLFLQSIDGTRVINNILNTSSDIELPKFSQVFNNQKVIIQDFLKIFNQSNLSLRKRFNIS